MKQDEMIRLLVIIMLVFSFGLDMYSVYHFENGLHNADLGQNIKYISALTGTTLVDRNSNADLMTPEELYSLGLLQMKQGLAGAILFSLMIGACLCYIVTKR